MVDISICIPVFCTEHYSTECLKSVALQTFTNYEIILVNDGSSGVNSCGLNCKKIEKECKKKYKLPITYLEHSKNLGVLEARRHAVEQAVGKYIYNGVLENRDIFHGYLVEENHCGYLCGKLISRDVYLEAFNHIPYMFCVMADDVIQYF